MAVSRPSTAFNRADSVALREYLEHLVAAQHDQMETRLAAIDRATELRESKTDVKLRQMCQEIAELKSYRDTMQGKASQQSVMVALLLSVAGLAISLVRWLVGNGP